MLFRSLLACVACDVTSWSVCDVTSWSVCLTVLAAVPLQETVNTGPFVMRSTCRRCGGKGSVISTPCGGCRGTGQTKQRRTVMVPVPAGETHTHTHIHIHLCESEVIPLVCVCVCRG